MILALLEKLNDSDFFHHGSCLCFIGSNSLNDVLKKLPKPQKVGGTHISQQP